MNAEWERENLSRNPEGISEELAAVDRAFDHYFELGFTGGLIRVDGRVVAYTLGEQLTENTFCTILKRRLPMCAARIRSSTGSLHHMR